jgi:hypothetical protein
MYKIGSAPFLSGNEKPAGSWGFRDVAVDEESGQRFTMTLVQSFEPDEVHQCYVHWRASTVNLELWSENRSLAPGESMTIDHL